MTAKKPTKKADASSQKQLAELEDSYKRLAAEFANFQRRAEAEKLTIAERAKTDLLEKLFPIMDNLERSAAHAPALDVNDAAKLTDDELKKIGNYLAGLKQIEKQLEAMLQNAGLSRIKTAGQPFDHNLHEAISHEPSVEVPADHIIGEVESGWHIAGKVIRPAKVRVSQG
ncbi:MAG TPA: nucleotide exchange factor GrpE [Candidatus Saccharimonadales bacterium]|nr:nucleotide exchange factor GrpE [Candidatus Saccharimonadales bacterium]